MANAARWASSFCKPVTTTAPLPAAFKAAAISATLSLSAFESEVG